MTRNVYLKSTFVYHEGMKKAAILNFLVLFREEPEGGFTVMVPSLPGCITYGETIDEAKKMAEDAIRLYIEDMEASGEEIPTDEGMFSLSMSVSKPHAKKVLYA